ncbi:MAG: hypothetical protein A2Y74_01755 [Actinobacteria bacterium RBG_13_63_9]|nr:MAG: hypothetical protein A2Y74_01755 [Actinobacteria bacterium RBG_13_63_9]
MTSGHEVATYELSNWRRDWQDRFIAFGICPWLSPTGDRVAAPVRDGRGWTVAVNGEPWEGRWLKVSEHVFSRDGKRVAAVVSDELGDTVAIDGQPWRPRFASALLPVLSFDGTHAAARVPSQGGYTVCVDGARWPEYYQEIDVLRFGPTGSRVAATVALEEMTKTLFGEGKMTIVVDGVAWPLVFRKCGTPNFSADGGKVAATVGDDRGETVAVDGVSWDAHFEGSFHCAISADGTHVVAGVRNEGRWTAAVDGQPWPVWFDEPLEEPRFSSDGQHVLATVGESPWVDQLRYELSRTLGEAASRPSPPPPFRVVLDGEIWRPEFVAAEEVGPAKAFA